MHSNSLDNLNHQLHLSSWCRQISAAIFSQHLTSSATSRHSSTSSFSWTVAPVGPVAPVSPLGIVKLNTAADDVPAVFVTVAAVPAAPVGRVPTAAAEQSELSGHLGPVAPYQHL
jgi:hypothetical protein